MSGGHFQYAQYKISEIADSIDELISSNDDASLNGFGYRRGRDYPPEVVARFRDAAQALRIAFVYAHRIDWLVSGDDGEESFLRRLDADLAQAKETP